MLSFFYDLCKSNDQFVVKWLNKISKKESEPDDKSPAIEIFEYILKNKKVEIPPLDVEDICLVLRNEFVDGKDDNVALKVKIGTYLNEVEKSRRSLIPRVSLIQLYDESKNINERTKTLYGCLKDFLEKYVACQFQGEPYELFHAYFERLKFQGLRQREADKNEEPMVLSMEEFYGKGTNEIEAFDSSFPRCYLGKSANWKNTIYGPSATSRSSKARRIEYDKYAVVSASSVR